MSDDLAKALNDAAKLAEQAAAAVRRGDLETSARLQEEAQAVWFRARRLGQRQRKRPARPRGPTARERTIAALTDLSVPSSPKQIAAYAEARTGEPFDVRALASVRRDEFRSWSSGSRRETYLVPSLEGPWFSAGRGRLALSSWPLAQRIVGPLSPRADHLIACLQIADRVEIAEDGDAARRMRRLLVEYARSVPAALDDAWTNGDAADVSRVRAAALAELELIRAQDQESRDRESDRAMRQLGEEQLLWGGTMPQVVAPTSG